MASLYFHTLPGASSAAVDRASIGARWMKLCDSGQIVRAHGHGCKVFWRPFLSERDAGDCGDGAAWAGEVWRDLQANGGEQPECLGFRNEMHANVRNAAEYLRYRATLRSFGYRGLVALGSFAVGTPDWPEWAALKAGLGGYPPDAIDAHEYWDLTIPGSATYYALRHVEAIRRGLLPPEWPVFVGECGSDGIWKELDDKTRVPVEDPQGRRGWQDRGKLTAQQQSVNLAAYAAGCAPSVAAAFVFADGTADPNWQTFRTFDTPVEAAIRATWPGSAPQSRQDAASGPVATQTAPAPVVTTAPNLSKGNYTMPLVPIDFRQAPGSLDCWVENLRRLFSRYGILLDEDTVFQAGKGYHRPAGGEAADFPTFRRALETLARANGVLVGVDAKAYQHGHNYLQVLEIDTFPVLWACLNDGDQANPWSVVVGENNAFLNPAQAWQHYISLLQDPTNSDTVNIYDPATTWDGDASQYSKGQLAGAILNNWDSTVIGYACKIVAAS